MFNQLEIGLQMKKEEILIFALYLNHPEVLNDFDCLSIILFLNRIEVIWLSEISKWTKLSKENVLMKVFDLDNEEKTIYHRQ